MSQTDVREEHLQRVLEPRVLFKYHSYLKNLLLLGAGFFEHVSTE